VWDTQHLWGWQKQSQVLQIVQYRLSSAQRIFIREGEGVAARVLEMLGADPTDISTEMRAKGLRIHIGAMSRLLAACSLHG
jgi:hypothetical protein